MSEEQLENQAVEAAQEDSSMDSVMSDPEAPIITMRKLLEAGSHFGHHTRRWNPKMKKYIWGERNHIYIIDLAKTVESVNVAYNALKEITANKGKVLFVGTRAQYAETIRIEAERSGSFYINSRWLGGTLTNFKTIASRIKYLKELELKDENGTLALLPKTEAALLRKEKDKLFKNLNGIKEMRKVPEAIIVINPSEDYNAVREAKRLNIPVFAIVDTNTDPEPIDFPIPASNDGAKSVALLLAILADAIVEGKGGIAAVAHSKDELEEVTMKEVIKQTEKENNEKLQRIRAERAARSAQYQKEDEQRKAAQEAKENEEAAEQASEKPAPKRTRKPAQPKEEK